LADQILSESFLTILTGSVEPFAGSAAMTIASAFYFKANRFVINDINEPLNQPLGNTSLNNPKSIIKHLITTFGMGNYGNEEEYYYQIRDNDLTIPKQPEYLIVSFSKMCKGSSSVQCTR
jgi:DNA adenine methylase